MNMLEKNGSDVFRLYLMFGFSYSDGGPWNDDGIKAMGKFIDRIERAVDTGSHEISKEEQ